jgi:hypothetical protein
MGVNDKRLQQGIFESVASANRFSGSGGGSGLLGAVMSPMGFATNAAAQTMTATAYTDVPQCIVTFPVTLPGNYLVIASWYGKISAAPAGTYAYFQLRLGTQTQVSKWGAAAQIFDKSLNAGFTNGSTFFVALLQPGAIQSAALQCGVDNGISALIQSCVIAVFALG